MEKRRKIEELAKKFLEKMGQKGEISLEEDKKDQAFKVVIKTEEPGNLIGFHGKTLSAFQLILGLMVFRELKEWQRVVVDVNDYRQEQTKRLEQMALNAGQKVKFSGQSVVLASMTPFERRIIHLALGDFAGVETSSQGEGDQRRVVISPKKE